MTLISSDVASLTKSLSRWEVAEYICAGFVTIACFGEYVADFTDWFTGGIEEHKKRLAKISTLVLVAALSLELICLVKTNQLSTTVIGSLREVAEEADTKARAAKDESDKALMQAGQAVSKADAANDTSGIAANKSNTAKATAEKLIATLNGRTLTERQRKEIADEIRPFAKPGIKVSVVTTSGYGMILGIFVWNALRDGGFETAGPQQRTDVWYEINIGGPLEHWDAVVAISKALGKRLPIWGATAILPPGSPITIYVGEKWTGRLSDAMAPVKPK
jgi:hypothetical protein